ncbi:phosphotransferase [Vogesella alkaliphila]|uniref:Hydroxylysine kinase n=1 Tax=Vogesella alkaliphila TaxID=1193621 RepID=A0ABQ2YBU4_9NEIS|nr:phosphotransferase [Vogesella alkaliphila]GGX77211.1 homoserine kinase [Vogesella alkaliphila]
MSDSAIDQLFSTMGSATTPEAASELLWQHYGLRGSASVLNSERDQNFHIHGDDGAQYVLKLTHPAEARGVTDFQTRALLHAASRDPALPIPRVMPRLDGAPYAAITLPDGTQRVLRLFSYLGGQPLHQITRSTAQRRDLGATLARLDLALSDFEHPSADHALLWDIQHSERLQPLLAELPPGPQTDTLAAFVAHFRREVQSALAGLRRQVIHNDLNPYNVLVDAQDQVTTRGLIDFGDMVQAPLICELAVACSYQLSATANPLDTAAELIAGYHALYPLQREEVLLLYELILTRLCMTVTITGWRASRYPENRTYILRNNGLSWDGLQRLQAIGREQAQAFLLQVCGMKGQA